MTLKRGGWYRNGGGGGGAYFITFQLHCIFCVWGEKVKFPLLRFDSSVLAIRHPQPSLLVLKHCIIYIFLIHSDSAQKILTALFISISLEYSENYMDKYQGKCFLILKMFWGLNALPYCFFLHIFEVKVSNFYWSITWEMKIGIKLISKFWSNGVTPCKSFSILPSFFMPHVGPK